IDAWHSDPDSPVSVWNNDAAARQPTWDERIKALKKGGDPGMLLKGLTLEQMKEAAQRLAFLSAEDKPIVYTGLAKTASGAQLAALTRANGPLAEPLYSLDGDKAAPSAFVQAIMDYASPQTKLNYINWLAQ